MPTEATPTSYAVGHLKHNPTTNEVAMRTIFPEDQGGQMALMTWIVATPNMGSRNAKTPEVTGEGWVDIYTPPEGSPIP